MGPKEKQYLKKYRLVLFIMNLWDLKKAQSFPKVKDKLTKHFYEKLIDDVFKYAMAKAEIKKQI